MKKFKERSVGVSSSLKIWKNSAVNPSDPGLFFFGKTIAASISLLLIDLFR
jgi:hypothetical protein